MIDPNHNSTNGSQATESPVIISERNSKGQVRMAVRLRRRFGSHLIYVPQIGWHYWDKVRWRFDELGKVDRAVLRTLDRAVTTATNDLNAAALIEDVSARKKAEAGPKKLLADATGCQSSAGIRGIKEISQKWPEFARHIDSLNSDYYVLNLNNCTLNLMTEECRAHDPADLITKVCNASFDAGTFAAFDAQTHCPLWNKFLSEVLPDSDVRAFVQRLMGHALIGTQREHILPIFTGDGRNGKGVFAEVLSYVLGDYAVQAASDIFTSNPNAHSTSQTDLMGARLAIIDETDQNARLSESLVKKMTGGGKHTARRMRHDNISFHQSHLPIMITNYPPRVEGQGVAIWDRIHVVPFNVYIPEHKRDPDLADKLKSEANGIFMWAYRGWLDYHNHGGLQAPAEVKRATTEYKCQNDRIQLWIDEKCSVGPKLKDHPDVLLSAYNDWAKLNNADQMGKHLFLDHLRRKGYPKSQSRAEVRGLKYGL